MTLLLYVSIYCVFVLLLTLGHFIFSVYRQQIIISCLDLLYHTAFIQFGLEQINNENKWNQIKESTAQHNSLCGVAVSYDILCLSRARAECQRASEIFLFCSLLAAYCLCLHVQPAGKRMTFFKKGGGRVMKANRKNKNKNQVRRILLI